MSTISSLKNTTTNQYLRRCVHRLWEMKPYKEALSRCPDNMSIDDVFRTALDVYAKRSGRNATAICEETETARKILEDMSKQMYGSRSEWKNHLHPDDLCSIVDLYGQQREAGRTALFALCNDLFLPQEVESNRHLLAEIAHHTFVTKAVVAQCKAGMLHSLDDVQALCEKTARIGIMEFGYDVQCYSKMLCMLCEKCGECSYDWAARFGINYPPKPVHKLYASC